MAPAWTLSDGDREQLQSFDVQLTWAAHYKNAGTVEFLVDKHDIAYFIEINRHNEVVHAVTEEVTGECYFGGIAEQWRPRRVVVECRINNTEDPEREFALDTCTIKLHRHSAGRVFEWMELDNAD